MKLNYPKIVEKLDLAKYNPSWGGQVLFVWVNPPSDDLVRMADMHKAHLELTNIPGNIQLVKGHLKDIEKPTKQEKEEHEKMLKFYEERLKELESDKYANAYEDYLTLLSGMLSQGADDTHVSVDDLKEIEKATKETDPAFWNWLQTEVVDMIANHRTGQKKG